MRRSVTVLLAGLILIGSFAAAQNTRQKGRAKQGSKSTGLPDDDRLLALHRDFVLKAQGLATEYERKKDYEKAKVVYGEILKLTPRYKAVQDKLDALIEREATAKRAVFTVAADKGWQNTGIRVIKGKPVMIKAAGTWTFTLTRDLTPDGMTIPKELQKFKLGSLLGVVQPSRRVPSTGKKKRDGPKPFRIGSETKFIAEETGYLYVSMYDDNHSDNKGVLKLLIQGTFERD